MSPIDSDNGDLAPERAPSAARPRGGRPTRAAAAERDERLLDIALRMFLELGFDATSMDGIAEAAAIGKATLYARYHDKAALFAAVLRRGILRVYGPMEEEFKDLLEEGPDMEPTLRRVARRLVEKSTSAESIAFGRILATQGPRFPELAQLAIKEGLGRQLRLVETVLVHLARRHAFISDDFPLLAELFLSIVLGRTTRLAMYGITVEPDLVAHRTTEAVRIFVRGLIMER